MLCVLVLIYELCEEPLLLLHQLHTVSVTLLAWATGIGQPKPSVLWLEAANLDVCSVEGGLQHLGSVSELLVRGVVSTLIRSKSSVDFYPGDRLVSTGGTCPRRQEL